MHIPTSFVPPQNNFLTVFQQFPIEQPQIPRAPKISPPLQPPLSQPPPPQLRRVPTGDIVGNFAFHRHPMSPSLYLMQA